MAVIETWFEQDLQKPVKVRYIDGNLFSHNGNGNRIGVIVTNNGEAVTLTGTVSGYAVLADGTTVPCTGTRSGNKASILVPAAAYSPGSILISIFLTDGTTVTTLAALSSSVIMARTGNQIDPGSVVADWTNTINAAMQSVETAAANLGNIVATPYANLTFPVPLGKYTIYNNGLYRCISPIASSEAWTAAHWTNVKLGDDVADLKSALKQDFNIIESLVNDTYHFTESDFESGTWSFTTKETNAKRLRLKYLMPIKSGMTFTITSSSFRSTLGIFASVPAASYAQSSGWANAGSTATLTATNDGYLIAMLDSTTNISIADFDAVGGGVSKFYNNAVKNIGALQNNTNFNTLSETGFWFTNSTHTYSNSPLPSGVAGVVFNYVYSASLKLQIVYSLQTNANIWIRSCVGGNWFTWAIMKDYKAFISRGLIATNTDFDTITTPGVYFFNSGYTYTHSPFSSVYGGALIVLPEAATGSIVQIAVSYSANGNNIVKLRMGIQNALPAQWADVNGNINNYTSEHYENTYNITCSPTITADTNNYLASTGDQTDRTADIQAMLAQNGVCHLGPGLFMVSGVDIPSYKSIIGSGKWTTVRLLPSVENGYVFRLNDQSSVHNLRISGGTSAPTLSATVGTRHGILFEGTKVSGQTGGTTHKRSSVDNVIISNFSGGGITCTGTGVDLDSNIMVTNVFIDHCNAGIYIPYYSEFHRFTNCACTYCYYGCYNNGGNNVFTNCDFSGNRIGILIDNSTGQSPNNSHGTYSACTINHSYSDDLVINQGTAIRLLRAVNGEIFEGLQIHYGKIEIVDSVAIRFANCQFGRGIAMTITGSKTVTFLGCSMYSAAEDTVTQSNNTNLKFAECYTYAGDVYNPVA